MSGRPTAPLRAKKSLGQNFLRDEHYARRIVEAVDPRPGDAVLEVGPGQGALTGHIAATGCRLAVVDLDRRMIDLLQEQLRDVSILYLHQDVLTLDLEALAARMTDGGRLRVVGNIPYYITTPILFHVLDHRHTVRDLTIMTQREVARRMVATPSTKEYGILSVFCQLFADVMLLFDVPPGAFQPRPKVTSSVVQLRMLDAPRFPLVDEQFFRSMVRSIFGLRRKMLRNSLERFAGSATMTPVAGVDLTRRPEQLSLQELVELGNRLYDDLQLPHRP